MKQTLTPHSHSHAHSHAHSEQADHNNAGHEPTYKHERVELTWFRYCTCVRHQTSTTAAGWALSPTIDGGLSHGASVGVVHASWWTLGEPTTLHYSKMRMHDLRWLKRLQQISDRLVRVHAAMRHHRT